MQAAELRMQVRSLHRTVNTVCAQLDIDRETHEAQFVDRSGRHVVGTAAALQVLRQCVSGHGIRWGERRPATGSALIENMVDYRADLLAADID
jgi:hypothetical protein